MRIEADQVKVRCVVMRGGTSKGPFFHAEDLPPPGATRDALLLRLMGALEPRRVDGIGGIDSLTNKIAIISKSECPDVDVDYLFGQICVHKNTIDYSVNCGNMLCAVGPFAVDEGLVAVTGAKTRVRIHNVNTGKRITEHIVTVKGRASCAGDATIDGVSGSSAPVVVEFRDVDGAKTGALLPTGRAFDMIDGVKVSCIDAAVPMAIVLAADLGVTGHEPAEQLNADAALCARVEQLRRSAGALMGLGDVSRLEMPKLSLVASPAGDATIAARYFMPYTCHTSFAVTGAVCLAAACRVPDSVAAAVARLPHRPDADVVDVRIEHPAGTIGVAVGMGSSPDGQQVVRSASLVRTARRLLAGDVYVPLATFPFASLADAAKASNPRSSACTADCS